MGALVGLLFLGWLFVGPVAEAKCPPLRSEVKPVYTQSHEEYLEYITKKGDKPVVITETTNGVKTSVYFYSGSTTWTMSGEFVGYQIGEEPNLEAIEHNKRVRECQTANGEF